MTVHIDWEVCSRITILVALCCWKNFISWEYQENTTFYEGKSIPRGVEQLLIGD